MDDFYSGANQEEKPMDLVIRNARLDITGEPVEIGIQGGLIAIVATQGLPPGVSEIDASGCMASPALINPHFHLENALLYDRGVNHSGTLREAIRLYAEIKRQMPQEDIVARAADALRLAIRHGTLWLRNHVDIDQIGKLHLLEGVAAARRQFEDLIDIQIVAFPQLGLARNPEAVDLMWEAMRNGANVVGGMPHGEADMDDAARQIEIAFEIARASNADIDMHVDETDDPYWHTLELLADQTIENGWQGRVSAGHCCAMAAWDDALAERVIEKVAQAKLNIITNSPVNLLLQGRGDRQPVRRGITRVKQLLEAGVNVTCGQDDLQNMFYPYGNMDMLEVAMIVGHAAHLSSPAEIQAAFDMPRYRAAQALRLEGYGIRPGAPANLVLLDAANPLDALCRHPDRRYVIRQGKVLVETATQITWHQ
jgi:cytosine deaminase